MKRYSSFGDYLKEGVVDQALAIGNRILSPTAATTNVAPNTPAPVASATTAKISGSAQNQLNTQYGYPDQNYVNRFCETWNVKSEFPWFPATSMVINKDFKAMLQKAFQQIQDSGLQNEIKTFNGCREVRPVRGGDTLSIHSWGAAIDLNASTEYQGKVGTNWSPAFLQIMRNNGIKWGGDWNGTKDPMHFAMVNG